MRNGIDALWVNVRRRIARRLPPRSRLWLEGVRDTRRHNVAITRRHPAASSLCFYPQRPTINYAIFRVAADLGLQIVRSRRGDGLLTIAWCDTTFVPPAAVASLPTPTLNARCLDISKSTVDRIWREVSGRGLSLDPLTSSGPMVVKSEENATHDGRIIMGPIRERQPGLVYQRLVDTRVGDHFAYLRPVILDGRIVLTYHKRRPLKDRFASNLPSRTWIAELDVFSVEERDAILHLAARIGLDYGEIDVLRDADGAIYVVDVNKTPWWSKSLSEAELKALDERMAAAFRDLISRYHEAD
jgi:hypothetical protein